MDEGDALGFGILAIVGIATAYFTWKYFSIAPQGNPPPDHHYPSHFNHDIPIVFYGSMAYDTAKTFCPSCGGH